MRYIGSKARIAAAILDRIGPPDGRGVFVDAFCGTGSVATEAARRGWPVRVNDHLACAVTLASASLVSHRLAPFTKLRGYAKAVQRLQEAPRREGFIWREYSPASVAHGKPERRYFTEENAKRIDGMRALLREWQDSAVVTREEAHLLLADLLAASSRVANTAGTYGCFLREWSAPALRAIELRPRRLPRLSVPFEAYTRDVWDVPFSEEDVAYFDPPYTKRQYAAYYHILETIALGDEPIVEGITGLRPWQDRASAFCYKSRALNAIVSLLSDTSSRRIFLSYSSEAHVPLGALRDALEPVGSVAIHAVGDIGRYRPNGAASANGAFVSEYLIELVKVGVSADVTAEAAA